MVCFFVEVPGFEPGLGEPKSHVLPLHHTSIAAAKLKTVLLFGNTVSDDKKITWYTFVKNF
jgi:hypothetical protein